MKPGGAAARAGLRVGDSILDVAGGPVGRFGRRVYETWPRFGRSGDDTVELLVGTAGEEGEVRYFYPEVRLDPRTGPG